MVKRSMLITAILAALAGMESPMAGDRIVGRPIATRSEVLALHGMAAGSQPLATQAALDILKAGGNAIDAAIAANAVQGVTEPTGNGIGGDIFVMIWDAGTKKLYGYNGSGRSPKSLTLEILTADGATSIPQTGPLPVSVPGCVDGWFAVHERFGKLPMKDVLAPAIRTAREGFPVTQLVAEYWARGARNLGEYPNFAKIYMPGGRAPLKGEIFLNPYLANTLETLADDGPNGGRDAFYKGRIAHTIDAYMKRNGGYLSYEDLAEHRGEWVEPVSTNYRGYDVWELPPNGQGIAALQILNILEGYDLQSMGFGSMRHLHLFIEAKKLAFEDRAKFYADPAFNQIPVPWLISKDYAAQRRQLLDLDKASRELPAGEAPEGGDTIYLTTADSAGNMVSLIQSNYRGMGSGMTPDNLGFILQDRGELFTLEPGRFNTYAPGKRPFHTIIPAFVTKDGEPFMTLGVMGGDMQPQGHVEILTNIIDFGMNFQEAGDAPRIYHEGSSDPTGPKMTGGGIVHLETGFAEEVIERLRQMGHDVRIDHTGAFGGYQAIHRDPTSGVLTGASESRNDGAAMGY
jgi:gamma-glutamyltranspeptidase/glutathione hydrolase